MHDSFSKTQLNKNGLKQAKIVSKYLASLKKDDRVIIITPLERSLQTVLPFLEKKFPDSIADIQKKYQDIQKIYQDLRNKKEIQSYIQDTSKQNLFQINERLYVDFRTTDIIIPELQDKIWTANLTINRPTNTKLSNE